MKIAVISLLIDQVICIRTLYTIPRDEIIMPTARNDRSEDGNVVHISLMLSNNEIEPIPFVMTLLLSFELSRLKKAEVLQVYEVRDVATSILEPDAPCADHRESERELSNLCHPLQHMGVGYKIMNDRVASNGRQCRTDSLVHWRLAT